jgi:anthranilate phosphoribosyltransferase
MTAGAALLIAGKCRDYPEGVRQASRAVDSGAARDALGRLVKASNQ